jgi:hypothetical protein
MGPYTRMLHHGIPKSSSTQTVEQTTDTDGKTVVKPQN